MQISVYDTYVQRPDDRIMHFDILVPATLKDIDAILEYGRTYLKAKGVPSSALTAEKCRYCHIESAESEVEHEVKKIGFTIVELKNCD
jgi:Domain of unknown function (DUF2024)